jgi:hypothetical protein
MSRGTRGCDNPPGGKAAKCGTARNRAYPRGHALLIHHVGTAPRTLGNLFYDRMTHGLVNVATRHYGNRRSGNLCILTP